MHSQRNEANQIYVMSIDILNNMQFRAGFTGDFFQRNMDPLLYKKENHPTIRETLR
jgi:hypothetical protein